MLTLKGKREGGLNKVPHFLREKEKGVYTLILKGKGVTYHHHCRKKSALSSGGGETKKGM